jgi:hypothetical protein
VGAVVAVYPSSAAGPGPEISLDGQGQGWATTVDWQLSDFGGLLGSGSVAVPEEQQGPGAWQVDIATGINSVSEGSYVGGARAVFRGATSSYATGLFNEEP